MVDETTRWLIRVGRIHCTLAFGIVPLAPCSTRFRLEIRQRNGVHTVYTKMYRLFLACYCLPSTQSIVRRRAVRAVRAGHVSHWADVLTSGNDAGIERRKRPALSNSPSRDGTRARLAYLGALAERMISSGRGKRRCFLTCRQLFLFVARQYRL